MMSSFSSPSLPDFVPRVRVVHGECPNSPPAIVILANLGGGGVVDNYYVNYYRKDDDPKSVHTVAVPQSPHTCNYPAGTVRKLTIMFSLLALGSTAHQELGYSVVYGQPTHFSQRIAQFVAANSGHGRVFQVTGNKVEMYITASDPLYAQLSQSTLQEHIPEPYTHVQQAEDCPSLTPPTKQVVGWEPLAGGYGLMSYTLPYQDGVYMVEVTDEHFVTSSVVIEVDVPEPKPCHIEWGDVSSYGKQDGWVRAQVRGFHAPFLFRWYDAAGSLLSEEVEMRGLGPGTYCLELIDAFGCSYSCCAQVTEPLPLKVLELERIPSCDGSYRLVLQVEGGVVGCGDKCADRGEYRYAIGDGAWTNVRYDNKVIFDNLTPGRYRFRVMDCGCNQVDHVVDLPNPQIQVAV